MTPSPLNLKKGNYVQHNSGVVGQITKMQDPFLFIETKNGDTVKLAYFPVNFTRLTRKEYQAMG